MTDQSCPSCGMNLAEVRAKTGHIFPREGTAYCCRGCAEGTGCTCL